MGALRPQAIPRLNRLATAVLSNREYTDRWDRVFTSARRVRFTEMEYALPLENFAVAFAQLRSYMEDSPASVVFPVEVRTAASEDTWLGTASGRDSVYIAVHKYINDDLPQYFSEVEKIMCEFEGRPHWGKEHSLGRQIYLRDIHDSVIFSRYVTASTLTGSSLTSICGTC